MKIAKLLFFTLALASLGFSGCFIDIDDDDGIFGCIDADGPITSVELELDDFEKLELAMDAQVILTQGDVQEVTFEGKSDILDELNLDIRSNGTWIIRTNDCVRDVDDLTFYITTPYLERIELTSSGDIRSTNTLLSDDIDIRSTGSGEINIALEADDTEVDLSGSGDVYIEGEADELNLTITGSGDFEGFDFACNRVDVRISGSGDAEVRANDALRVRISGSGDVLYRGQPTIDVTITGSGELIDAN
jgi:autotransporter translocation and assembly factor TamB